jgi:hypothetical protein
MADVRIVIGSKYEVMQDERRRATADFADWLRNSGISVDLEIIGYEPGRRGLTPIEWTEFFIGASVGGTQIARIVATLYESGKKLLRTRRQAKKAESGAPGLHLGFKIYGPDKQELAKWTTREDEAVNPAGKPRQKSSEG